MGGSIRVNGDMVMPYFQQWALGRSLSRLASLSVTVVLLASGCVVIPTSATGPLAETKEASLVGSTEEEIRTLLGEPAFSAANHNTSYLAYGAGGTQEYFIATHPLFYILAMSGPVVTDDVVHCLLVELRDDKVIRARLESVFAPVLESTPNNCPRAFSKDEDFMAFVTDWLKSRMKEGDASSAFEVARKFRDPAPLQTLAEYGDTRALAELAFRRGRFYAGPKRDSAKVAVLKRDGTYAQIRKIDNRVVEYLSTYELLPGPHVIDYAGGGGKRPTAVGQAKVVLHAGRTYVVKVKFTEFRSKTAVYIMDESNGEVLDCIDAAWQPWAYETQGPRKGPRACEAVGATAQKWYTKREPLQVFADQGDTEAAIELAKRFDDQAPLRLLAARGDRKAALELARTFNDWNH